MPGMAEDLIFILEKNNAELEARLSAALRALAASPESDAALNLMGVLHDLKAEGSDPVAIKTVDRVVGQIIAAQRALMGMGE